jgi:DNA-directed RNA polymerase specialized sigma24 family protein
VIHSAVVWLHYCCGYKVEEIANGLGIPWAKAKLCGFRARNALRKAKS